MDMDNLARQYKIVQLSGLTNMFDRKAVQYYAYQVDLYDLVAFIEKEGTSGYSKFLSELDLDFELDEEEEDKVEELREMYGSDY